MDQSWGLSPRVLTTLSSSPLLLPPYLPLSLSQFRGLPVALAQQIYVDVRVNCSSHSTFCQKSHFSSSKAVAASLLHTLGEKTRYLMATPLANVFFLKVLGLCIYFI